VSHREIRTSALTGNARSLQQALSLWLRSVVFAKVVFRVDCRWTPLGLTVAALLWGCSGSLSLTDRWEQALEVASTILPGQVPAKMSYQAFLKMLRRWTPQLRELLLIAFRSQIAVVFPKLFRLFGFAVFTVDGSRVDLPRTKSHEAVYTPAKYRNLPKKPKKKGQTRKAKLKVKAVKGSRSSASARARQGSKPMMWITTLWHVTTGLAWNWRLGPSDSSERAHLREMLASLPRRSLIIGDAGFVGYDFLKSILDAQQQLLIRVGSNVRLLRKLGTVSETSQTVYLWPEGAQKRQQPPLVLRLIVLHDGRKPVYLVTSILDDNQLSDARIADLYRRRWGIELYYRHLKQTFGRGKLRSCNAENADIEMHWALLALGAMLLRTTYELRQVDIEPSRLSVAAMLKAFRSAMNDYHRTAKPGKSLQERLQAATIDMYTRKNKASRNYPRKHPETAAGAPVITTATKLQRQLAKTLVS
jgi:hypothetical protein